MLSSSDNSALAVIREYLEEIAYGYVNYRLVPDQDNHPFPPFDELQAKLKVQFPIYRLIFSLFRQGHVCDEAILREALPKPVFDALEATGLIEVNRQKEWRTPGVLLLSIEGLYIVVSIPSSYPTCQNLRQPIYFGPDSIQLIHALPAQLEGARVLDVCSGSGIQGLICAARGASYVLCLERAPEAVAAARFNAALNGLADTVEVRESDLLESVAREEVFDFFVSTPPCTAAPRQLDSFIGTFGGSDGTSIVAQMFRALRPHMSSKAKGIMYCTGIGSQCSIYLNRFVLNAIAGQDGFFIRGFVQNKVRIERYKEALKNYLREISPRLSASERTSIVEDWLRNLSNGNEVTHFYDEVLRFWVGRGEAGLVDLPAYNPLLTDPLVEKLDLIKVAV